MYHHVWCVEREQYWMLYGVVRDACVDVAWKRLCCRGPHHAFHFLTFSTLNLAKLFVLRVRSSLTSMRTLDFPWSQSVIVCSSDIGSRTCLSPDCVLCGIQCDVCRRKLFGISSNLPRNSVSKTRIRHICFFWHDMQIGRESNLAPSLYMCTRNS